MQMETILVTGAAGFIGFHLSVALCKMGYSVIGVDSVNDYYSVSLKEDRLAVLKPYENFTFYKVNISDKISFDQLFKDHAIDIVINLAAQAGVRYSINHPYQYIDSNINGFMNVLEACRNFGVKHLIYASSSSVYGGNTKIPFSTDDNTDSPVSLYAATKKANEVMAHSYSSLYDIPCTGLRFFTVYGSWGRPDMAYYLFTDAILKGKPISLFNHGDLRRDFTYIDDIVSGIVALLHHAPADDVKGIPYKLYNIGNNQPVQLMEFVATLEELIGKKAIVEYKPMQPGDVYETYAEIDALAADVGFSPKTDIKEGLKVFVDWYKDYYKVK